MVILRTVIMMMMMMMVIFRISIATICNDLGLPGSLGIILAKFYSEISQKAQFLLGVVTSLIRIGHLPRNSKKVQLLE